MDAQNIQRQVNPMHHFDAQSALQLAESRPTIENFFYDFCGLQPMKKGNEVQLIRVTRPTFTYEFAKDLVTKMYVEVNLVTGRTTYDKDKIRQYIKKKCETMMEWFAVVGIHKLISDRAWQKINDLAELDPDTLVEGTDGKPSTDAEGNIIGQSFWQSEHNIVWNYNMPVNDDMLRIVKKKYELTEESFGQDTILRDIFWSVRQFLEGGLNKSKDALTLGHEKVIHKESVLTTGGETRSRSGEGFLDRIKRMVGGP